MGNLIWHEYSRLVAITASVCESLVFSPPLSLPPVSPVNSANRAAIPIAYILTDTFWAGFWGLIWRKFFWDFVGGTLRDPGGFQ